MDETALMQTRKRPSYATTDPQKLLQFPWFAEQGREHRATMIVYPQRQLSIVINEF
jgi:hypothetical protein